MSLRAALLVALLWPVGVSAQPAPTPPTANVAKAQAYIDLSGTLFRANDFAGALDALRKAEPLLEGDPSLGVARFNIARCLEELGRPLEAAAAYELYLTLPDDDRRRIRATDALAELLRKSIAILAIRCTPKTSDVRVGEGDALRCPIDVRVPPGSLIVRASAPDYAGREFPVSAVAGQRLELAIELVRTKPPQVVKAPPTGRSPASTPVDPAPAAPKPQASRALPFALLGVGAATVGAGVVFHLLASSKRDEAGNEQQGDRRDSLTSEFETLRLVAFAAYGVGLASAGIGTFLLLRSPSGAPVATAQVTSSGIRVVW